jgi:hypothetical protein
MFFLHLQEVKNEENMSCVYILMEVQEYNIEILEFNFFLGKLLFWN